MSNPYHPYYLCDTLHFTYNGKNVWGTIVKFGKDYFTCLTKDGYRNYKFNKMVVLTLCQCRISDLIMDYKRSGNMNFEYLYRNYA